jgi:hypothetical protein
MIECSGRLRLAQKSSAQVGRDQCFRPWDLERHAPVQSRIVGQKNDAMPATPKLPKNLESSNRPRHIIAVYRSRVCG